ncbi:MAG TPA: hypothetical protein VNF47_15265 [Streptosporangiaceae bacterium]|nr:hypothetical protein [Streptosporangiaceae bacterium]
MRAIAASQGQWDQLIVLCAVNRYDGIAMGDWHLAHQLSKLCPVLYVDPPMSRLTPRRQPGAAAALGRPRLRVQQPGSPGSPPWSSRSRPGQPRRA